MRLFRSENIFLQLAGPGLEALAYIGENDVEWQALHMIGGFTALTRLELQNLGFTTSDIAAPIRTLPLQELVLVDCKGIELSIFMRGALTSLRKLHLEQDYWCPAWHETYDWQEECNNVLRSLPHLHQISGSRLFCGAIVPDTWHWQYYPEGLMTAEAVYRRNPTLALCIKPEAH